MKMSNPRLVRRNGRIYDFGTQNRSFLQVAADLKKLGIKNYFFLLELNDPELIKINPHAVDKNGHTTLTDNEIARVMKELYINPWYYLREVCRIPDQGGSSVPYIANRGNIAQAWCIFNNLDSWLCLPRQKGKTLSALAAIAWLYQFGTTNSEFIFVNKDGPQCKENLRRTSNQIDVLPEYLRFESVVDEETGKITKGIKNATKLGHPINKNSIIIKAKATSYDAALSLARGLSAPVLYFDEPEFTENIKTIVENSVSTFEKAASRARANGAPAARIFTCTPGDLDTAAGKEGQELLNNCAKWSETLYDKNEEEIQEYLQACGKSCNDILYIEYKYYQIGETREWLEKISRKIANALTVRREILLQRLHGSSKSPWSQEDVNYVIENAHKPIGELWLLNYYKFDIYKELIPEKPYIVSVDCSTGTSGDNNAITITDPTAVPCPQPVAEFECSFIGETKYENLIKELVTNHIPKACVIIERNSIGDGIIDHLLHSHIANNLYFDKDLDLLQQTMKQNESVESMLKKEASQKSYYGVYTGTKSRQDMMAILATHMTDYKEYFITQNIVRDISRLIRTSSGKVEADSGFHDDSIMSYLIGMYVYYHGNNLPLFGIFPGVQEMVEEKNKGIRRADDVDPSLVPRALIEEIRNQEEAEGPTKWEQMMRDAAITAERERKQLQHAGLITATTDVPGSVFDTVGSTTIEMDFFDELNF